MDWEKPTWRIRLNELKHDNSRDFDKIVRYLMGYLHKKKLISLEDLEREIIPASHQRLLDLTPAEPNRPSPRPDRNEVDLLNEKVLDCAEKLLAEGEVDEAIHFAYQNEAVTELGQAAEDPSVPFEILVDKLNCFRAFFKEEDTQTSPDIMGSRVALIRRIITDQLEYINVAKNFFRVESLAAVAERVIVPGKGLGKIGGKAAGLILANHILQDAFYQGRLKNLPVVPRAYYIRSDGLNHLIRYNNIEEWTNIKYRDPVEIQEGYPNVQRVFKNASFPPQLLAGLSKMLDVFTDKPLIIRSSSLLEDRSGAAFSGKYKSLFVANRGLKAQRMEELTNAVAEVYASTLAPDPIIYRREKGLLDFQEEMGILIQEVVGERVGPFYLPLYAGVAFSNNEIRWSPRIRRQDGVARLVAGMGTRAVDRTSDDYAFLMSPGQPQLRTNIQPEEICYYSQRLVDVVDLDKGHFATVPIRDLFRDYMNDYPNLHNVVSIFRGTSPVMPIGVLLNENPADLFVTFEGLIRRTGFPTMIKNILDFLAEAYSRPVDIEFAADAHQFYLLQCRVQPESGDTRRVYIPKDIPLADVVFSANRYVQNGIVKGIEYIVYIDPHDYEGIVDLKTLVTIGQTVGLLNRALPRRRFILMGPGRWGSRGEIKLGVRVTYADINNCAILIEIARRKGNYIPEVSFGTHFFQDLLESEIRYLPLYPDDDEVVFKDDFLRGSGNCLTGFAPQAADLAGVIRVIHVPSATDGKTLTVAMDAETDRALAYFEPTLS